MCFFLLSKSRPTFGMRKNCSILWRKKTASYHERLLRLHLKITLNGSVKLIQWNANRIQKGTIIFTRSYYHWTFVFYLHMRISSPPRPLLFVSKYKALFCNCYKTNRLLVYRQIDLSKSKYKYADVEKTTKIYFSNVDYIHHWIYLSKNSDLTRARGYPAIGVRLLSGGQQPRLRQLPGGLPVLFWLRFLRCPDLHCFR